MEPTEPPTVFTFVVKLWHERATGEPEESEWRGELRDVTSGQIRYFRFIEGVVAAMRALMGGKNGRIS